MQKSSAHNVAEIYTLTDTSRRINSMSLVHEMLYNDDKTEGVQFKNYIQELTNSINELINTETIPVKFNLNIADAIITASDAIALGMITSELVSNSIKYAFVNQPTPVISIVLEKQHNFYTYTVADNGIGLNNDISTKNKLGMRLIDIFSRQLKGKYQFENNNGFTYILTFDLQHA